MNPHFCLNGNCMFYRSMLLMKDARSKWISTAKTWRKPLLWNNQTRKRVYPSFSRITKVYEMCLSRTFSRISDILERQPILVVSFWFYPTSFYPKRYFEALFLPRPFFPRTLLYVLLNKLARCLFSEKGFFGKYGAMTRQQRANIGKL